MNKIDWNKFEGKKILIYGAHLVAVEFYRAVCKAGYKERIIGFAVTDLCDNPQELCGYEVKELRHLSTNASGTIVAIAMPEKYHPEAMEYAQKMGFSEFEMISLERMSQLKGEEIISTWNSDNYRIIKNDNDPTWLDMVDESGEVIKYPTLFYLSKEDVDRIVEGKKPLDRYNKQYENIQNLEKLTKYYYDETSTIDNLMNIYMAYGKSEKEMISNLSYGRWIKPLLVGGNYNDIAAISDDDFEHNISFKNLLFAEMTGTYWIWKRGGSSKYKGLCHYRRHFLLDEEDIWNIDKNEIDALLTIPRYVPGGIKRMFMAETPVKESVFESISISMKNNSPEDEKKFVEYVKGDFYCPNNMVVAKKELFDRYCEWIFSILFEMEKVDEKNEYGHKNDRHIAYAAELLTSFYFLKKEKDIKIAVTDYKYFWEK